MNQTTPPTHRKQPAPNLLALFCAAILFAATGCEFKFHSDTTGTIEISILDPEESSTPPPHPDTPSHPGSTSDAFPATARVMSYNIQNFTTEAATHGNRTARLRQIITEINPDVVALQEIADRDALHLIFSPDKWTIIIDDDSRDRLDLAFAVRKPWTVLNAAPDLDADDEHFLAPGPALDTWFPVRRDALFVRVATPDGRPAFTAINVHYKSRVGGRANTRERREGASRHLVKLIKEKLPDEPIVLMGDFNDSPDDIALNILETGNPEAVHGNNPWPSNFLINLHQPKWSRGKVTLGIEPDSIDKKTGLLNVVVNNARQRNDRGQNSNTHTGPIMFDQILASPQLAGNPPREGNIYKNPIALQGPGFSRPSDHLPVFADLTLDP